MEQEDTMDFKALRAKFQDEELLLKQPRNKPALPEKPKVVPPPQSPTHYLPAGARPSLLTSINKSLEGKTMLAPRVIFKDEKKESKKSLIQTNTKGKDKTTKGSKEKLDSSDQKQKKESSKDKKLFATSKESTAELVQATPPPKAATPKKKALLGFRKSSKRKSVEVPADPILDTPSSDIPGPAPLIPVPSDFDDSVPEPEISAPKALLPNIPPLPDSTAENTPHSITPTSPDLNPPQVFIPDIPAPEVPTPESETPLEIETPALPVSTPDSQDEIVTSTPSTVPIPPPSAQPASSSPPPVASTPPPEPEVAAVACEEAVDIAVVEQPPPLVTDAPSVSPSPKAERPISALSFLERAEDMSPGKKTPTCDQRIFSALEKARKMGTSPLTNPTTSYSYTPPPEEIPPPCSPTPSIPALPPIDYGFPPKPKQVNGIDHGQASPVVEGISEEGSEVIPELLMVPPPPPRRTPSSSDSVGTAPDTPARPPSAILNEFIPPPLEDNEIPAPVDFSETDTTDVPEFDDVASDAHSPELPVSEWGNGEYLDPDTPDEQNLPELYTNGLIAAGVGNEEAPALENEYQDNVQSSLPESSSPITQDSQIITEPKAEVGNGIYECTENVYEDVTTSVTKKKGKGDGGKKRKGPPKNPYAEAPQETNEEKRKTGRFGKSDKKTATEGPDEKELKKKEKQRLEKEKKELKEKQEREKKELKEREKKENEMKKKFNMTGQEDAMYQAKVTVTTKGRKHDLPVKDGDIISIIRTTNCPKGKWLARDSSNNYGYIAVDHVELDIKEMLELGKKAAITRQSSSNILEPEVTSMGSRTSNQYPLSTESFEDDSEEWTCDDDELLSTPTDTVDALAQVSHTRTVSMPDMGNKDLSINHQHSHSADVPDGSHVHARHEALQKLATFFYSPKPVEPTDSTEPETSHVLTTEEAVHLPEAGSIQEIETLILPPPDVYAD
ncbi:titin [Scomber scombrus]|uniref:Titin n=1 Tax=Scomber scombrus TaxID=13677 RepID=A0AAV1NBR4_SCOSC